MKQIIISLVLLVSIGAFFSMKRARGMGEGASGAGSAAGSALPSGGAAAAAAAVTQASSGTMVKLLTSDAQEVAVPQAIAMQFAPIKYIHESGGDISQEAIPVAVTKKTLDSIIILIKQLDAAPANTKRPLDGKFIAQRIQPMIDAQMKSLSAKEVAHVILAAEYLDLPAIVNGAIRVLVTKVDGSGLNVRQHVSRILAKINPKFIYWDSSTSTIMPKGLGVRLKPIIAHYVILVKDNIPELSIADYIAINGQSGIRDDLSGKQLTSLDGLDQIEGIANAQKLNLSYNNITTIPEQAFAGLSNLLGLDLSYNKIITIQTRAFAGLPNLQAIDLKNNQMTRVPLEVFRELPNLQLKSW